jgi:hypothetical protein
MGADRAVTGSGSCWIVVILGGHGRNDFQRLVSAVAIGFEDDHVAISRTQCQDAEHASGVDAWTISLANCNRHRLRGGRLHEECRRSGVQADP